MFFYVYPVQFCDAILNGFSGGLVQAWNNLLLRRLQICLVAWNNLLLSRLQILIINQDLLYHDGDYHDEFSECIAQALKKCYGVNMVKRAADLISEKFRRQDQGLVCLMP